MPDDSILTRSSSWGYGESLRCERERQGISLDDVARSTRIPRRYLDALESGNLDDLPGLIFARNFVRQYAEALHIDAEPIVSTLPKIRESMIQLPDPATHPRRRSRFSGNDLPWSSLIWIALAIGAGFALYTRFDDTQSTARSDTRLPNTAVRSRAIEAATALAKSTAEETPPSATVITPTAASGNSASPVRVAITASQNAWVKLSADGETLFAGMLRPNETKEISAAELVELVAGNAGGISVLLNGKALDPLGRMGQVRHVRLTAEGWHLFEISQPALSDFAPPDSDSDETPPAAGPL